MAVGVLKEKPYPAQKRVGKIEVGKSYHCVMNRPWESWIYGECVKIYMNSAQVRIYSTSEEDEDRARRNNYFVVVPLKKMIPAEEW